MENAKCIPLLMVSAPLCQPKGCACRNITPWVSPAPQGHTQTGSKQEAKPQLGKHSSRSQHTTTTAGGRGEIGREPPEHSSGLMGQCQWLSEKEEQHITHFSLLKTSVTIWSRTALRLRWSWRQIRSDMALTS